MTLRALLFSLLVTTAAAKGPVHRIDPPNWWIGMHLDTLELMLTGGPFIAPTVTSVSSGVEVLSTVVPENPSYAFVLLKILPNAHEGAQILKLTMSSGTSMISFPLLRREDSTMCFQGFGPSDVIYLLMPDRFANGDLGNDSTGGMLEGVHRQSPNGRHGGDIQGILDHLDYLKDLGVSALWMNPLLENNAPFLSYHGYAATDLYRIDPRFGTNDLYRKLVHEAHRRGLKIIMDHVSNHIGINHPWTANLPSPDWLNGSRTDHLTISHIKSTLDDPHSDSLSRRNVTDGWFSRGMPDLNQRNPHVARYLIQNAIWWVEFSGLDGIREDTSPYVDPHYLNAWCRAILREYPHFNIVGEVWMNDPPYTASFQRGNRLLPSRQAQLPTVTDFPLYEALKALVRSGGTIWPLENCLAMDFCYPHPESLLTFVDNHDVPRLPLVAEDSARSRMALAILLTTRGIPEILYGTELGIRGGLSDGEIRADMPGGFPGDQQNAFTRAGRTAEEEEWFGYLRRLIHLRRSEPALGAGRLVQFPPVDEVYVYFRLDGRSTFAFFANNNAGSRSLKLGQFPDYLPKGCRLDPVLGGSEKEFHPGDELSLEGFSVQGYKVISP